MSNLVQQICEEIELSEDRNYGEIPSEYTENSKLLQMIYDEIETMAWEIGRSEAGKRSGVTTKNKNDGEGAYVFYNTSTKSTFPTYLSRVLSDSNATKANFLKAVKSKKGLVWNRIALEAIDRLTHGYRNHHGYDEPDMDFLKELKNPTDKGMTIDNDSVPF